MRLKKLLFADIYRDGGSYEARFECDQGAVLTISLLVSEMPDGDDLHHRLLYVYSGRNMPTNALPIPKHSMADRHLLATLSRFIESGESVECSVGDDSDYYRTKAKELTNYIARREPILMAEIQAIQQRHELLEDDMRSGRKSGDHFTFAEPLDLMTLET